MGVKKVYLTWDDVYKLLDKLHGQVKEEATMVTGIPRGGIMLAILYSHRFNIEYFDNISNHYPHLLVLDDIADTGKTFKKYHDQFPAPIYASLHYKKQSIFKPRYFVEEVGAEWIVYPWEREDAKTIQDYLDN
jgi:hypoxanthine phosphoribosyltransferase